MALQFSVLSSGSRANSTLVRSASNTVLIDCGLSLREIELRIRQLDAEPSAIEAIVISHEHTDHTSGVRLFVKRYGIPVYMNRATAKAAKFETGEYIPFESGTRFSIGDLSFNPVPISHDAAEPVAFRIDAVARAFAIVTDLGYVTPQVEDIFHGLDALVLESNHDKDMLQRGPYPWHLKQRILSRVGHISNCTASSVLEQIVSKPESKLKVVVGAHVSEKNNTPELVHEALSAAIIKTSVPADRCPELLVANAKSATRWVTV